MKFNPIEELIEDIRNGKMVLLVDDEDRENEGDLVLASDFVTPEAINFMAKEARGLICLSMTTAQVEKLKLPLMVSDEYNHSPNKTAFTVSIEAASGVSTGISAADRAHTVRVAANPNAKSQDIHIPGHIFPIRAQNGGVLKRAGHTEGSVDLAKLAGLNPAAVICEVMNDDGTMARVPDLIKFAQKHKIKIGTIVDLIEYRIAHDTLVEEVEKVDLTDAIGAGFCARIFRSKIDHVEHVVIQKGEPTLGGPELVRVHTDSFTREFLTSLKYGQAPIHQAIEIIKKNKTGILLLLRSSQQNTQVSHELKAFFNLTPDQPMTKMDSRDYGIGAQILRQLGVHKIILVSNKPEKRVGLKAYGLEIVSTVPLTNFLSED